MNKMHYTFYLLLIIIFFSSCSSPVDNQAAQPIEPTFTLVATPPVSQEPTFYIGPTEIPNPTDAALYFSPDQITDGRIRLTIKEDKPVCHSWENPIAIRMTFKNLTFKPINIVAVPETWRGPMVDGILTRSDRTIRYCLNCVTRGLPAPSPVNIESLPALGAIEKVIQYKIIAFEVEVGQGNYIDATPEPGVYFLKFVYHNVDTSLDDVWTGQIASNQIQICIAE